MPPTLYSPRSGACRCLLLAHRDRLGVEFFDFFKRVEVANKFTLRR
jgi:hypothetical protein